MKQNDFLKFNDWKQQPKPQFEWIVTGVPTGVFRLSDGEIFIQGELVSFADARFNYTIIKFSQDMIHVILGIYPYGHMKMVIQANKLSKEFA